MKPALQPLCWHCSECAVHRERNVREEQHHIYVARRSNNRVNSCCLLPQCKALHTCCSGFLIATPVRFCWPLTFGPIDWYTAILTSIAGHFNSNENIHNGMLACRQSKGHHTTSSITDREAEGHPDKLNIKAGIPLKLEFWYTISILLVFSLLLFFFCFSEYFLAI